MYVQLYTFNPNIENEKTLVRIYTAQQVRTLLAIPLF